jgi:hypothetical protein
MVTICQWHLSPFQFHAIFARMTNAGAEEAKPVVQRTHHEYTFLTKETAATHTMDECVKHFHSTEQGVKSALTRKGISETKARTKAGVDAVTVWLRALR